ncbi:MAG TPA: diacylglycerol kinase family protein [Vicinamibacterales bacterium]|nr:diacylglycerol kinase family protein [Vicinamibacterales bacterium]
MPAGSDRAAIIVNPIAGTGGRPELARRRIAEAESALRSRNRDGPVLVTQQAGHGSLLAREAIAAGASLVIAWGGDGTINEVASELVFRDVSFAVIPSGSGNGLARELKIPCDVQRAFEIAFGATERVIDAGEIEGRLFFNVAGVGLDAEVAHEFAATGLVRRGFRRYIEIAMRRLLSFKASEYRIVCDGVAAENRALVVAIANGRQYGNGAIIAPAARIDDGKLEVIVIGERSVLTALAQIPMLFTGRIARVPGITMTAAREVRIESASRMTYHADGEPCQAGRSIAARIRPRALRVRVP